MLDTLRLLQRTLGEHISVETHFHATAAMVLVDRNQLTNALLNLAVNARDAMPEGGQLTVTTKCQPSQFAAKEASILWPEGEEVCIVVRDTGTGMTEEVKPRFRALLHDQGGRPGHRTRAEHGAWVRAAVQRTYRNRERTRTRHDDHHPAASSRYGELHDRNPAQPPDRAPPREKKPCCWSRTTLMCGS